MLHLIPFAVLIIAAILSLPSPLHASPHIDDLSLSPEPQQYVLDQGQQNMVPPENAPYIENNYPYAENPSSLSSNFPFDTHIEPPYSSQDNGEESDLYYNSPSEAPSPSPSPSPEGSVFSWKPDNDNNTPYDDLADPVTPEANNVLPFNYSAEDDAGEFTNENYYNEGYHVEKEHVAVVGYVVGAVCLVGLGGFVWKRKKNQKRKQYQSLYSSKRDEA